MSSDIVKTFYTGHVRNEWHRLFQDAYRRLEFETTLHYLDKYLPEKGCILDLGGGVRADIRSSLRGEDMKWS